MATQILEKHKRAIWLKIQKYLKDPAYPAPFRVPPKYKKEVNFHWKVINDYPNRKGKYLRPTLVLLACTAMGEKIRKALTTAAAMQLSEEWILIHDDIQDDSLMRRGLPTLQRIYGPEIALNAGDTLHVIMWKVLNDNYKEIGIKKASQIVEEFNQILMRTTLGQNTEIKWAKEPLKKFKNADWYFVADSKSAYYTIAGPLRLGAIIAGASARQLETLAQFGVVLGRCFQLVDDILDLTSDFGGLKKQRGNDIYEGKRTIMLGHLLRNIKNQERKRLIAILGKTRSRKTQKEVNWIINQMHKHGSISYAKSLAIKLKNRSLKIFEEELDFLSHEPARSELKTLIHFVLERDR